MDRYDRIIADIIRRTDGGDLRWVCVRTVDAHVLTNAEKVMRMFRATYQLGERKYHLLFVERRVDGTDEFDNVTERIDFEVHVLGEDREVVLRLYEGVVDKSDLLTLASLIDDRNDRATEFFEAFDRMEVA